MLGIAVAERVRSGDDSGQQTRPARTRSLARSHFVELLARTHRSRVT
jgi:hypothetical protein